MSSLAPKSACFTNLCLQLKKIKSLLSSSTLLCTVQYPSCNTLTCRKQSHSHRSTSQPFNIRGKVKDNYNRHTHAGACHSSCPDNQTQTHETPQQALPLKATCIYEFLLAGVFKCSVMQTNAQNGLVYSFLSIFQYWMKNK